MKSIADVLTSARPKISKLVVGSLVLVLLQTFALPNQAHADASTGSISFARTGTKGSPGNNQYLSIPGNANYVFSSDFTIEAWVKFDSLGDGFASFLGHYTSGYSWVLQQQDGLKIPRLVGNYRGGTYGEMFPAWPYSAEEEFVVGRWQHIALVRNGSGANNLKMYLDGVEIAQETRNGDFGNAGDPITVGSGPASGNDRFSGSISNIRFVKNTAIYTGNFTPSTSPLTAVPNTVLLLNTTNDANSLRDSSPLNATVTAHNGASTTSGLPVSISASPFLSLSSASETAYVGTPIAGYSTLPGTETYTATIVGGGTFSSPTNGISFNSTTGVFSGTPVASAGAVSYRVTGSTSKTTATYSLTVALPAQTISFSQPTNMVQGSTPAALVATATPSGYTVAFASTTTGVCTVSGTTLTILTAGTCSITASQNGNPSYSAANNVVKSFSVYSGSLSGTATYGQVLTANATSFTPSSYQWKRSSSLRQ